MNARYWPLGDQDGTFIVPWPPKSLARTVIAAAAEVHEAELHVLVFGMIDDAFFIGEEDHLLAVGRDVREPVVQLVLGELFLVGAVGLHPPDLHRTGAVGVEVDELPVAGVFGAVVLARAVG